MSISDAEVLKNSLKVLSTNEGLRLNEGRRANEYFRMNEGRRAESFDADDLGVLSIDGTRLGPRAGVCGDLEGGALGVLRTCSCGRRRKKRFRVEESMKPIGS